MAVGQIAGAAQTDIRATQEVDQIAIILPALTDNLAHIRHQANHANHGRGVNRLGITCRINGFVIERDITARDRGGEGKAGFGETATGFGQLPVADGLFRTAEVEVIGDSQRFSPNTTEVAVGFGHSRLGTFIGIEVTVAAIAVGGSGNAFAAERHGLNLTDTKGLRTHPHDTGIGAAWRQHSVVLHLLIVLAIDPGFARDRRFIEQLGDNLIPVVGLILNHDARSRGFR